MSPLNFTLQNKTDSAKIINLFEHSAHEIAAAGVAISDAAWYEKARQHSFVDPLMVKQISCHVYNDGFALGGIWAADRINYRATSLFGLEPPAPVFPAGSFTVHNGKFLSTTLYGVCLGAPCGFLEIILLPNETLELEITLRNLTPLLKTFDRALRAFNNATGASGPRPAPDLTLSAPKQPTAP